MVQALEPGDPGAVGRYRLVGRLGRGGMGLVYLGESPGGRRVAVKLIRAELAADPEFRDRFAREVATARTVSGIYTVPVVDADVDAAQPWLVTAYVAGPSLAEAVRDSGPLAAQTVATLAAGLAEGLEVIHAAGVVHRDLKPSNVLLAADGPRIIDFGISKAADAASVTRTGWVTGSPGYMSPEQAEGRAAGPASDIFSLGSVLAYAATGRDPFGAGSGPSVLYRVVHAEPDTAEMPEPLRSLARRCLAKDPAWRPSAREIVTELAGSHAPTRTAVAAVAPGDPRRPGDPRQPGRPGNPGDPLTLSQAAADLVTPVRPVAMGAMAAPGGRGGQPRRRRPGALVLAAVAVVAVAAGGGALGADLLRGPAKGQLAGTGAAASGGAAASQASAPAAGAGSSGPASATGTAGWVTYRDPSGFTIGLPRGWAVSSTSLDEVRFTGPLAHYAVVVAWTSQPKADAYTDWQQQAAAKAASDPSYQQLAITRVSYRGWNAADWEFINDYDGAPTRVLDRGFIVQPGVLGYAIELFGPPSGFAAARASLWAGLTATFRPA